MLERSGAGTRSSRCPLRARRQATRRGIDHVLLGSDDPQTGLAAVVDALERLDLTGE